jgi:polysaccharide pyruvyl transferase WcaK-like protein
VSTVVLAGSFGRQDPGAQSALAAARAALPDHDLVVVGGDRQAALRAIRSCDAVVLAGSGVFDRLARLAGEHRRALPRADIRLALAARARGRTVAVLGVGVPPLAGPLARRTARSVARRADLLVVRDDESAARLIAAGAASPLRVGADPAWAVLDGPPASVAAERRDEAIVTVSRHVLSPGTLPRLAAGLAAVRDAGLRVRLQPWQDGGPDADVARDLAALTGDAATLVAPARDLTSASARFRDARLVVATRFHALVAAAAAGTPGLAVQGSGSLAALARRLKQPTVPPAASAGEFAAATVAALVSAPAHPAAVQTEIAAARAGFTLLRLVLGDPAEPVEHVNGLRLEPAP